MNIFFKRTNHILQKLWRTASKDIAAVIEEMRAIMRNRNYMVRYPKLFAIFAIIEHEQSSQVFETNHADFLLIKNKILHDDKISNHHILESLRNIFQTIGISDKSNKTKTEILHYIRDELEVLLNSNNRYYDPLIKAILQGFPLLLAYEDYAILKKIMHNKSRNSLKLLRHILDGKNFPNFFVEDVDVIEAMSLAYQLNSKHAFMLLLRFVRENKLFALIFDRNFSDLRNKILSAHGVEKKGIDYAASLLSYYEDQWFNNEKRLERVEQFLHEIFSHHLRLQRRQKVENRQVCNFAILASRRLGFKNFIIEKMLNEVSGRFIDEEKDHPKKLPLKLLHASYKKLKKLEPATRFQPTSFFAIVPLASEEYWLLRFAAYLL